MPDFSKYEMMDIISIVENSNYKIELIGVGKKIKQFKKPECSIFSALSTTSLGIKSSVFNLGKITSLSLKSFFRGGEKIIFFKLSFFIIPKRSICINFLGAMTLGLPDSPKRNIFNYFKFIKCANGSTYGSVDRRPWSTTCCHYNQYHIIKIFY